MTITYSTYDAEAKFSEVLDLVREGETVAITHDGEIFAEFRPIKGRVETIEDHSDDRKPTIEDRLEEMRRQGTLVPSGRPRKPFELGKPSPGALARFLADRNE